MSLVIRVRLISQMKPYLVFPSVAGSEDKTPQASLTHHDASRRANQSQTLEVTDNDDEPIGDRWEEEEDWGSLEVELNHF